MSAERLRRIANVVLLHGISHFCTTRYDLAAERGCGLMPKQVRMAGRRRWAARDVESLLDDNSRWP